MKESPEDGSFRLCGRRFKKLLSGLMHYGAGPGTELAPGAGCRPRPKRGWRNPIQIFQLLATI